MMSRRGLMLAAGSAAAVLPQRSAYAFDLGAVFGGVASALCPAVAVGLAGFALVKGIDLISNANSAVDQAKNLEAHFDQVLSQVSSTLSTIQTLVQDCDNAIHDIEDAVKQLPAAIAAAFDAAQAKAAFARLRADSANMSGYLGSKGSMSTNRKNIQKLCEKIVGDISQIDAANINAFQYLMQVPPGLTTWMQGYTSYNLLLPANSRGMSPWDHPVVSAIALPKINGILASIKKQSADNANVASQLPLDSSVVYTFDGSKFTKSGQPFAVRYADGTIANGFYYAVWPNGAVFQGPPGPNIPAAFQPQPGDLCYLIPSSGGFRFWAIAQKVPVAGASPFPPNEYFAAMQAANAAWRQMVSALNATTAFDQLATGWQTLDSAVQTQLVKGDRDKWLTMPQLA